MSKVICLSQWSEPYYQSACERFAQLAFVLMERSGIEPGFDQLCVYKKYANKKFLKVAYYALLWVNDHYATEANMSDMVLEE